MTTGIASLFVEIGVKGAEKVEGDLKNVGNQLNKSRDNFNGLSSAAESLALPLAGAAAGLAALGGALYATAGATVEYAGQVEDLARAVSVSSEDASKLIQAADDAKISYETLTTASRQLIQNGIQPSIENIGKLAEEYNSIQDPVKKSQLLLDNFGRSGLQMGKLLEMGAEGIASAAAEAEQLGLVLSEADVAAAEELRLSMDALTDTVEGLKVSIGNELIPVLNDAAIGLDFILNFGNKLEGVLGKHAEDVLVTAGSYDEYATELGRAATDAGYMVNAQGDLVKMTMTAFGPTEQLIKANYLLSEAEYATATAIDDRAEAIADARQNTLDLIGVIDEQKIANERLTDVYGFATDALRQFNIGEATRLELEEKIALATGAVTQEQLDQEEAVRFLTKQLELGNITMEQWAEQVHKLSIGAAGARDIINGIGQAVKDLPEFKNIRIDVNAAYGGAAGEVGLGGDAPVQVTPGSETLPSSGGFAEGGTFTVPGVGHGDRPYRMNLTPGETVTVTPKGQAGAGPTFNMYVADSLDVEMVARRVAAVLAGA